MNNVMIAGNGAGVSLGQNITRYFPIGGSISSNASVAENSLQVLVRDSLTWSRLRAYVITNTFAAGNTTTLALRLNGVTSTAVTISIDGSVTGEVEDLTGSESPVSGDLVNYIIVTPNVAGAISPAFIESLLVGSSGYFVASNNNGVTITASTTIFNPVDGVIFALFTTETWAQMAVRETVTWDRLRGWVTAIGTGGSLTVTSRKGAAAGSQSIVWTGVTGAQEDTTNSDSLVNADLINYSLANTNTAGTTTIRTIHTRHNGTQSFLGLPAAGTLQSSGLTRDVVPRGELGLQTVEAQTQVDANATRIVKNMRVFVSANSLNGSTTITLRKDGVDTAIAVTYAATTSGAQEDLVDSVTYTEAQEISTRSVTGGTMNNLTFRLIQYTQEDKAVAAEPQQRVVVPNWPMMVPEPSRQTRGW